MKKIKEKWKNIEFLQSIGEHIASLSYGNKACLENIDLSGIAISINSSLIKNPSLYKSNLRNVNLSYSIIDADAQESKWDFVDFSKAKLSRCRADKSEIKNCNFQCSTLIIRADDVIFDNCDFTKAKFGIGTYGYEYGGRRTTFYNCNFTSAIFKNVEFRASKFFHCNFNGTRFIKCDLRGMKVEGETMLKHSQFEDMEFPNVFQF
jgi:uncharacterized protein YjbI with pentapeptide repeats